MPIRDLLVTAIVVFSLPVALVRPFVGVIVFSWLGFMILMIPHRLSWGFAHDLEFSAMVAVATILGLIFTKDRRMVPRVGETYLMVAFWALTLVSTVGALYQEEAWPDFKQFSKILLMIFVTIMLSQTRERLRALLLVTAFSLGFYGLRGGIFSLVAGGEARFVAGPDGSFIGDNNGLALGLNMTLPLLFFLAREESRRWLRWLLVVTFVLTLVTIPFTYSRGGFLGLVVVLLMLLARTRSKWMMVPAAFAVVLVATSYLPQGWFDRIATISTYSEDSSAMSRLYAWQVGLGLALDYPLFGGGFRVFPHWEIWAKYAPDWTYPSVYNAHSIYFHALGEHGFVGFVLLFSLFGCTLWSLHGVRRQARQLPDSAWMMSYSYMIEIGLVGFLVTGAFYNLTYFDLTYFFVAVTIILKQLVADARAVRPTEQPAPVGVSPAKLAVPFVRPSWPFATRGLRAME
jgi:probable O-glycosylation ligase (exosortase A-associated)